MVWCVCGQHDLSIFTVNCTVQLCACVRLRVSVYCFENKLREIIISQGVFICIGKCTFSNPNEYNYWLLAIIVQLYTNYCA